MKGGGGGGRGSGRKMYIQNEDELALRNNEVAEAQAVRLARRGDDDEAGEAEGDGEAPASVFAMGGDSDEEKEVASGLVQDKGGKTKANPNLASNQPKMMKLKDLKTLGDALPNPDVATAGMNRKEREAVEAAARKEAHQKKHMAGETPEAKKELAMLAIVRERREQARLKREAECRAPGWVQSDTDEDSSGSDSDDSDAPRGKGKKGGAGAGAAAAEKAEKPKKAAEPVSLGAMSKEVAAAKKQAALADDTSGGGPEKISSMEIKKMNPAQLKDCLKARNLDLQGQKKDLMKRLTDYEAARTD